MKILVSAYACETGRGSEGEIGWRLVHQLAEHHDVWVITRANLQAVHTASFDVAPKPKRLHFVYFDLPWIFRFYKRGKRFFLLYYYLWQIGVGLLARRLMRQQQFDILHHMIGGMDWMPAGLALCPGTLVWGPVGSENTHPVIRRHLPLKARLKDSLRLAVRWWMRTMDPFVRFTGWRAKIILTHTLETMPTRYASKMKAFSQTGIENLPTLAFPKGNFARSSTLQLIFAGELKDWKGASLALAASLKFFEIERNARLIIIGDGPLRTEMEASARAHPEGGRVEFKGKVPMDVLVDTLHKGDVFLYPSFHHGLGTVVLQAMLSGMPVVCIEGDATSRAIRDRAGITVPLSKDSDPIIGLANGLKRLAENEEERQMLAKAAQEIAKNEYSYRGLAQKLDEVFKVILSQP